MRIAVFGEVDEKGLSNQTLDSIQRVKDLEIDVNLDLILLEPIPDPRISLPCDTVFIYNLISGNDHAAKCSEAIEHYSSQFDPSMIIVSIKENADLIVPRTAVKLGAAAFLQCESISYDKTEDKISVIKSVYGGNALAHYGSQKSIVLSFQHCLKNSPELEGKTPLLHFMEYSCICSKNQIQESEIETIQEQGLSDSEFVVVCGKGVGSRAAVEDISRWAESSGAVVGGTKKVIDNGWLPIHRLVGQTGNLISPELCLVIGASGAKPFINGILGAKTIVAVNNDADARIFDYADFAVVEDSRIVIAGLLNELTSLKGGEV